MNIDFELYRIFYVVATVGNITKAAQELMISQPAVSKAIKHLEEQLGGVLFTRTKRGVILTEEGLEFYKHIKLAMEHIVNAENKFSNLMNLETGTIRIGISTTLTRYYLLPYLSNFHSRFPGINIQILTNKTSELYNKLQVGYLDIVIINLPFATSKEIEVIKLKEIHDVFIVGRKYLELTDKKIQLKELSKYPLVVQTTGSVTRSFFDSYLKDNGIEVEPIMNLASNSLVIDFVKVGFGVGFSTRDFIQSEIENGELFVVDVEPKIPVRNIGLLYSRKNLPSFCTRKFIEMIVGEK